MTNLPLPHQIAARASKGRVVVEQIRDFAEGTTSFSVVYRVGRETVWRSANFDDAAVAEESAATLAAFLGVPHR